MKKLTALKGLYDAQVRMNGRLRAQLDLTVDLLDILDKDSGAYPIRSLNVNAQKNHDADLATVAEQEAKLKGIFGGDLWDE